MAIHISIEEKEEILTLYKSGMQQKLIAQKFGRARSSINSFIKQEIDKANKSTEEILFNHSDYYRF